MTEEQKAIGQEGRREACHSDVRGDMLQSPRPLWERVRVRGQNRVNSRVGFSLPEKLDCQFAGRRKTAFTLAEVLITLGIIGIVAAMTLPSLIQKHQERVAVNKLKKFHSVIAQAQLFAIKEHGYLNEWDFPDSYSEEAIIKVMSYITPYLKISKDCGTESGCLGNGMIKLLNGNDWGSYDNNRKYYKLILNDGTYMWASTGGISNCNGNNHCIAIWIDVNGAKAPNTMGIDVFQTGLNVASVYPSHGSCSKSDSGFACYNYILTYGNMDYLRK
ncbi:type II secretion system protein [bacterium]|nr:type II secretion system protein [bacterium]